MALAAGVSDPPMSPDVEQAQTTKPIQLWNTLEKMLFMF